MATGSLISVEEYLRTSYSPDRDYTDGEVSERNVGEYPHSWLQGLLVAFLMRRRKVWNITPLPEQRIQIRPERFRVPDILVLVGTGPWPKIITTPPLLWIEILSSEDRPVSVSRKVREALEFGAAYVWVIDPETLESYVETRSSRFEVTDGVLRIGDTGSEIAIPLHELEQIDQ